MKPRKPSCKPKTFLIGQPTADRYYGFLEVALPQATFNECHGFNEFDGLIAHVCVVAFTKATGIALNPGECREFKLVEVKRKRKVKK